MSTVRESGRVVAGLRCAATSLFLIILTLPCSGQLVQPDDLKYIGAFRLPDGSEEYGWKYSGAAMACCPEGDPDGPADGYPGSIFATGHNWHQHVSEISIPAPVNSPSKSLNDLHTAATIRPFQDIRGDMFPEYEMPRVGLEYLPARENQTPGQLHFCWAPHMGESEINPTHGRCQADLSNPQSKGPWRIAGYWNYVTADYILRIPEAWVEEHTSGMPLATGRFRDGGQGAHGPSLLAYAAWVEGDPPPEGTALHAVPLLLYENVYQPNPHSMNAYHHSDEWSGAVWLSAGTKSAVVFIGTKGTGDCWYGCPDGTVWPDEPPYPPDCPDRGWWSSGFVGEMIFYDPDEFAAVASGQMETWEPQPYAVLPIDEYLYHITSGQQKEHVGAASFDRQNGLLYVFEPLVDDDKSIVHVWKVKPDTTPEVPKISLSVDSLLWNFAWVSRPSHRAFTVYNDGEGVLNVSDIASDDARYVPSINDMSIVPVSSQTLDVIFTPTHEGSCNAILTISSNDPERSEIQIALRGVGIVDCPGGKSGDVNGDGLINVIDVIGAVNHILGASFLNVDGVCRADCDMNGVISILDVLGIVNHILGLGECGE